MIDYEFYPTPDPFTAWLFKEIPTIRGLVSEPCVGDGAIVRAACHAVDATRGIEWITNDLDSRWNAATHNDATKQMAICDWTVTNPPFSLAVPMIETALRCSRVGVAMHLRASIHEVLKARVGGKRSGPRVPFFLTEHPPTGILWLPRFAYQRSPTTGKWTTDSVCACWVIWLKDPHTSQFIRYAPESVLNELDAFTKTYRTRMDLLMANLKSAALAESA